MINKCIVSLSYIVVGLTIILISETHYSCSGIYYLCEREIKHLFIVVY